MKHLYGANVVLAVALALTLALKLLFHQGPAPGEDPKLGDTVAAFLLQHGFETRLEKGQFTNFSIHANAGRCRMWIGEAVPQAWNRSIIELWAKPVGRLTYVFDGAVHAHQPFLAPMLDAYWNRVRIKMGLHPNRHPILAVAASDDCALDGLPWQELAVVS